MADMQNIQGQGFNNQQKCACGPPTGQGLNSVYKVCKLGEFCEPVDKNSPKSNCKKSSKDDIAAVEEEAAKVAAEEEKRLAKQSADMQNNNSGSSDGGYWWTFGLDMGFAIVIASVGGCLLLTCCCCVVYCMCCRKSTPKTKKNKLANSGSNNHAEVEMPAMNMVT